MSDKADLQNYGEAPLSKMSVARISKVIFPALRVIGAKRSKESNIQICIKE